MLYLNVLSNWQGDLLLIARHSVPHTDCNFSEVTLFHSTDCFLVPHPCMGNKYAVCVGMCSDVIYVRCMRRMLRAFSCVRTKSNGRLNCLSKHELYIGAVNRIYNARDHNHWHSSAQWMSEQSFAGRCAKHSLRRVANVEQHLIQATSEWQVWLQGGHPFLDQTV